MKEGATAPPWRARWAAWPGPDEPVELRGRPAGKDTEREEKENYRTARARHAPPVRGERGRRRKTVGPPAHATHRPRVQIRADGAAGPARRL